MEMVVFAKLWEWFRYGKGREAMSQSFIPKGPGAEGFDPDYWARYYGDLSIMDGVYNGRQHAQYLKSLFELEGVHVGEIVDLGFGLGHLLSEMIDAFMPYCVDGIEPSPHAFHHVRVEDLRRVPSMEVSLQQMDLLSWCLDSSLDDKVYDLGLCTSVFQYLSDEEIKTCIPILAKRLRFFYFTVPLDIELEYQTEQMDFDDVFAKYRSREEYHQLFAPGFTVVASRVLESKVHFDEDNSCFNELLYRY